jgi:hypothetical protein
VVRTLARLCDFPGFRDSHDRFLGETVWSGNRWIVG